MLENFVTNNLVMDSHRPPINDMVTQPILFSTTDNMNSECYPTSTNRDSPQKANAVLTENIQLLSRENQCQVRTLLMLKTP